jgi:hypothetical protein
MEEVVGRDASSKYPSPATEIILDYVLSHLKGDERPYLRLYILGISLLGLLDSGASRTVMGGTAWSQFQTLGLPLLSDTIECTVADGRVCRSISCIQVPVKLLERVRLITIHVVPSLIEGLLLGKDFWKVMEVVPDLSKDVWYFSSDVSRTLQISTFSEKIGLFDQSSLSPAQKVILEDLISEQSRDQPQSFGKVKTLQHHIEVQPNVLPIKQRYYPVSPTKQRLIDAEVEKMFKENIIEPSQSPWSSPVCLVLKKDRDYLFFLWRFSAFTKLKELLISAPLLSAPDFSRLFTIQCDASSFVLRAVLTQTFDDGERPICYLSRSLTRTERNLSTTEKECLCVIWAVEKLRHYLEGTRFVVITDHHSLLWLHRLKDPQGRLARCPMISK